MIIGAPAGIRGVDFSGKSAKNKADLFVSVELSGCSFDGFSFVGSMNFVNTRLCQCSFSGAVFSKSSLPCVFHGTDFTGAKNFPFRSKAEFIDAVGRENVDEETIWIDGTKLLDAE